MKVIASLPTPADINAEIRRHIRDQWRVFFASAGDALFKQKKYEGEMLTYRRDKNIKRVQLYAGSMKTNSNKGSYDVAQMMNLRTSALGR